MQGINYVTNEEGRRVAVQIDLKKYGEIWEDFFDVLTAKKRESEPRESLASVKTRLKKKAGLMSDFKISFTRSARKELEALPSNIVDRIFPRIENHLRFCRTLRLYSIVEIHNLQVPKS